MEKILSIIIPSYNAQDYLEKCVRSITACKRIEGIEAIIVNDGSTDGTLALAEKLRSECENSVRIINKENGGHGSGINVGAYSCNGKYFKVVDADDWVDSAELDKLVEVLGDCDADCVITSYTLVYESDGKTASSPVGEAFPAGEVVSYEQYVAKARLALHGVCYRTQAYVDAGIKMTEKCFYEDTQFIYYPLAAFKTLVCYPFNVYQYRLQHAGQSVSREGFMKHYLDHRRVYAELLKFYTDFDPSNSELKEYLKLELAGHLMFQQSYFATETVTNEQWKDNVAYIKSIKKQYPQIYKAMSVKYRVLYHLNAGCVRLAVRLFHPTAS